MVVCESCGGNCDHGELIQGICLECLEIKEKRKSMDELLERIEKSSFEQIELNLME